MNRPGAARDAGVTGLAPVAVVGAGPAGLAAAEVLTGQRVPVTLIDEQARCGGQFLRQPPREFSVAEWLPGRLYRRGKALLGRMEDRREIDWRLGETVYGISPPGDPGGGFELWLGDAGRIAARRVLIATGCYEMPVPFPGWTLPGVMGTGGIQTFLKSRQALPGARFLLSGSHPLQLIVADQILDAGGAVAAVMFSQSKGELLRRLPMRPGVLLGAPSRFTEPARILARLLKARVPVVFGSTIVAAQGEERVEQALVAPLTADGSLRRDAAAAFDCDTIGYCYGFIASSELARLAGAAAHWSRDGGGWLIDHDGGMRSSVPGLYVAGETTGVEGAEAAMAKGRLAALSMLADMRADTDGLDHSRGHSRDEPGGEVGIAAGAGSDGVARSRTNSAGGFGARPSSKPGFSSAAVARARRALARERRFAAYLRRLSAPPWEALLRLPEPETLICRCEAVTAADLDAALAADDLVANANAVKLETRIGMGLCQGRQCEPSLARVLAGLGREPRPFTARMPVKPVPIGAVIERGES